MQFHSEKTPAPETPPPPPPGALPGGVEVTGKTFSLLKVVSTFPFLFPQGADSLLDISSEADQQDLLVLLQAKVASLTLHNKELQDKLQVGESITIYY